MNVLMINGSPRGNGNTTIALREMKNVFAQEGIEVTELNVGAKAIRGCIACNKCVHHCPQGLDIPALMQRVDEYVEFLKQNPT